jgi:uroporphyrin-3 C-methyltransferase
MEQPREPTPASSDRRAGWVAAVAVLVAIGASYGAFTLWRELEAVRHASAARDVEAAAALAAERAELKTLIQRNRTDLERFEARLDALEESVGGLKQRVEGGRVGWLRAEIKYLLRLANDELHIAESPATALTALRSAEARLRELHDPSLAPVRERLRREIQALESLPTADVTGMAVALLRLEERVQRLPLKTRAPERYAPPHAPTDPGEDTGAWDEFTRRAKGVLGELVTVRRRNAPVEALLPPHEEYFLYRNLELKLETARIALLKRDATAFRAATRAARGWIALHFDARDPAVRDAVTDLGAMEKVELVPQLPDLSGSLELLRRRWPDEPGAP